MSHAAILSLLRRAPVAALSAQLRKRGMQAVAIEGVSPLAPKMAFAGIARTLRFIPFREDLFERFGNGYNAQKRAFDALDVDDVLIIEARGEPGAGTLGDILALRAAARGASGIVTDGCVRDHDAVAAAGIPVFSGGSHAAVLGRRHVPWESDVTIACGGAAVQPGDYLVGDSDGVIVIPPHLAHEVAEAALRQEEEDAWVAERIRAGHPVSELFPPNPQWRARFEAQRTAATRSAR